MPHKEIVYTHDEVDNIITKIAALEGDQKIKDEIIHKIKNFTQFDGEHFLINIFYVKQSILNYLDNYLLIINEYASIKQKASNMLKNYQAAYHATVNIHKPKISPEDLLFSLEDFLYLAENTLQSNFLHSPEKKSDLIFNSKGIPVYLGNLDIFKEDLKKYLAHDFKVILNTGNEAQQKRLKLIFQEFNPQDDRYDFKEKGFSIYPGFLANGFILEEENILFLNDYEILGKKNKFSEHFYSRRTEIIDSFVDIKPGDYVVHIHHGIGKFLGIERVKTQGIEKDYIAIIYADEDKIFIPIEQLNFVQKYASGELANPRLDRIGGKNWSKTKERVKKSVDELAGELIKLYAYRLEQKGFAFTPDTPWQ
jgi:transcription-repair coupling factor (superfamily II helicase)